MAEYRKGDRVRYHGRIWEVCWAGKDMLLLSDTVAGRQTEALAADVVMLRPGAGQWSDGLPQPWAQSWTPPSSAAGRPVRAAGQPESAQADPVGRVPERPDEWFHEYLELEVFDAQMLDVWLVASGQAAYRPLQSVVIDSATRAIIGFALGPKTHLV